MQCNQKHEMRDMGQWPSTDMKTLVHKFHCPACNEYVSLPVEGKKLVQVGDELRTVDA